MNRFGLTYLLGFTVFSPLLRASAAEHLFIANGARGANNGTDCDNARPATWFNLPANWTTAPSSTDGKIGPGDTVHLCRGISSTPLVFQGSGSADNPIALLFDPDAIMSAPSLTAISATNKNYIIIDGGTKSDGSPNAIIEATNSNTATQIGSAGINLDHVSNVEVKNFYIKNMYVRTPNSTDQQENGVGVYFAGGSNISIHNNIISHAKTGVMGNYPGGETSRHIKIYKNTIAGTNWGIGFGGGNVNAIADDIQFYSNEIFGSGPEWDEPSDFHHHNGIYAWAEIPGNVITNLKIYNNFIHGPFGYWTTAYIFVSDSGSPRGIVNVMIYNNVLDGPPVSNGHVLAWVADATILNNTFVGPEVDAFALRFSPDNPSPQTSRLIAQNNIFVGFKSWIGSPIYTSGVTVNMVSDHNLIWQDPHFSNANGLDFHLTSNSTLAADQGTDLSAYCTTDPTNPTRLPDPALCQDRDGNPRSQSQSWSIGAYEDCGGNCVPPVLSHGLCSTTFNTCDMGSFRDIPDSPTNYLWRCLGTGSADQCSLRIAVSPINSAPTKSTFRAFVNQFNPLKDNPLEIHFDLTQTGPVKLSIYTMKGELVKNLFDGTLPAGLDLLKTWDGTNLKNEIVANGIYLATLEASGDVITTKVAVIK